MRSLTLPLPPFPFCHSRARGNPGSVQLILVGLHTRAIPWRHLKGACGRGCAPVPNSMWGRGLFERSACPEQREGTFNQQPTAWKSRFLVSLGMTTERHRIGPRPGAHGFGSFCRNKRTSPCGGETPHSSPRRAGPKPRENLSPSVIPDLIRDPVSLLFPSHTPQLWIPAFAGMTARVSLLFPSHTLQLWIPAFAGMTARVSLLFPSHTLQLWIPAFAGMTARVSLLFPSHTPAFAGMTARVSLLFPSHTPQLWIPAFAGMTARVIGNPGSVSSRMSEYIQFYLDGCDDE